MFIKKAIRFLYQVGNRLTLKVFRKHIKRLVNYAETGDGEKIREELKRIVVFSYQ